MAQSSEDLVARAVTEYYSEKLGVGLDQIADTCGISQDRLRNFVGGTSSNESFTPDERTRFSEFLAEQVDAEGRDYEQVKYGRRPPFRTVQDALQERFGTKT